MYAETKEGVFISQILDFWKLEEPTSVWKIFPIILA